MTMPSVISSFSICAGRRLRCRLRSTRSTKSLWRNCRGLMFTHRLKPLVSTSSSATSCSQTWHASASTQAPTSRISPLSSSTWMNCPGDCGPRVGCCQRSRASAPITRLLRASTWGWKCSSNSPRASAMRRSLSSRRRSLAASCMVLRNIWMALRPESLARYRAMSARLSRSAGLAPWSGISAIPMLGVTCSRCPSSSMGSASSLRNLSAIMRTWRVISERLPSRPVSSTTNSSPPRRATVSSNRTLASRRAVTIFSTASPRGWPRESLMCLKWSRSRKSRAPRISWRCRRAICWVRRSVSRARLGRLVSGSW
ncbi:hypothetical protein D3C85_1019230 [compost metagenome]